MKMRLGWDQTRISTAPELGRAVARVTRRRRDLRCRAPRASILQGRGGLAGDRRPCARTTTLPLIAKMVISAMPMMPRRPGGFRGGCGDGRCATLGKPWADCPYPRRSSPGCPGPNLIWRRKPRQFRSITKGLLSLYGIAGRHPACRKHLAAFADHAAEEGHALAPDARARASVQPKRQEPARGARALCIRS